MIKIPNQNITNIENLTMITKVYMDGKNIKEYEVNDEIIIDRPGTHSFYLKTIIKNTTTNIDLEDGYEYSIKLKLFRATLLCIIPAILLTLGLGLLQYLLYLELLTAFMLVVYAFLLLVVYMLITVFIVFKFVNLEIIKGDKLDVNE